jgi:hypothetical protein
MKSERAGLIAYWFVPKEERGAPFGIGVTAFDLDDARRLISEQGWNIVIEDATVTENVAFEDLDQKHVPPNMGVMVMRGVWYPCLNIGWGASGVAS